MSPRDIAFVTTCKGRLEHLKLSLPRLVEQGASDIILVDYACPQGAGDWAAQFPEVRILRIADYGPFHAARARNIGLAQVNARWVFFIDADVVLAPNALEAIGRRMREGSYHSFEHVVRKRDACGTFVAETAAVRALGGYDEVMHGWGGEDLDMYWRMDQAGLNRIILPHQLIDLVVTHTEAVRTGFHAEKNLLTSQNVNALYRLCKQALARLDGAILSGEAARLALYARCGATIAAAMADGAGTASIDIAIPQDYVNFRGIAASPSLRVGIEVVPVVGGVSLLGEG